MKIERLSVRRVGDGENAMAWASELQAGSLLSTTQRLKDDGGSWVRRARFSGREVVIKCRPHGANEALKRTLRSTRGDRQWRGASWLMRHGFSTAKPLLLADAFVDGVRSELLVTAYIDARSVLEHLAAGDLSVGEQHEVARALGRMIAEMDRRGRWNRDGKPSNLLLERDDAGAFRIVVIDTVAIRRAREFTSVWRALANLYIEPLGCGVPPRRSLCARAVREVVGAPPRGDARHDWELVRGVTWGKVREIIAAHGDPTPRVNPLAP